MKQFEEYFTEKTITSFLCKLRAKQASKRNKKNILCKLTGDAEYNYHKTESENYSDYEKEFYGKLSDLLPKRRMWIEPNKKGRIHKIKNEKLSTPDKNASAIAQTISVFRKKNPTEPFLNNLTNFVKGIQNSIQQKDFQIANPVVYPKLKKYPLVADKLNECRPISLFNLEDRIVLSLTSRFFTELFDDYFQHNSFAFRARNKKTNILPSHHDCIKAIQEFKFLHKETELWSVECDMEKFYDSVNHDEIRKHFYKLIERAKTDFRTIDLTIPIRIFEAYLNCYSFSTNTFQLNSDTQYWENHLKDKKGNTYKGKYGWVLERFEKLKFYSDATAERIGVPQGGALSGLIANVVLDVADLEVKKTSVFYARFCDDMIILHPDKAECEKAKKLYIDSLLDLKLVPHDFCKEEELKVIRDKPKNNLPTTTIQPFWDNKSKGPYKWGAIQNNGFPWIGFVGYELHFEGHIRVRKSSLQKELKKQKDVIFKITKAVEKEKRKSWGTVGESTIHTLVGMSVGRVQLKNFDKIRHELCWNNGFKELAKNKYSIHQIKQLDRSRNKLYYKLIDELDKKRKAEQPSVNGKPSLKRQIIDFNKPFSYYYQVLERKELINKEPLGNILPAPGSTPTSN